MSYRKISQAFWEGDLAARLRGDADALAVAFYVMTCPSCNAIGCYRLSLATLVDDTGIPVDRARKALKKLNKSPGEDGAGEPLPGFLDFDETYRMMFVGEFARHEWGKVPNPKENRTRGLPKMLSIFAAIGRKSFVWTAFRDRYADPWGEIFEAMPDAFEAVPTPSNDSSRARQDQGQEEQQEQERSNPVGDRSDLATKRKGSRAPSKEAIEISWRVEETWRSFLDRRLTWYDRAKGAPPSGRPPTMTEDIEADIRRSLRVHDADLLTVESREEWQRDSKTRAAGEGMYLKEWNIGIRDEDGNGDSRRRASTYLEPWRPWKIRKRRDPVDEYAEVYFQKRAAHEMQAVLPSEAVEGYLFRRARLEELRQMPESERQDDENDEGLDRFEETIREQLAEINLDPELREALRRAIP